MADLKVTGLVELARALKKNVKMDDVKTVVQKTVLTCRGLCSGKQILKKATRPVQQNEVSA